MMDVIIAIARSIKAALSAWASAKITAPAPVKVKLNGRRGYGDDDIPTPKP